MVDYKKPNFIRLDITSGCNFNCVACYRPKQTERDVSKDDLIRIIDEIDTFGVKNIIISGGEPFTKPYLEKIVMYAHQHEIKSTIVTNATLIQERHQNFIKKYVSDLNISLDGHNEAVNSKTRPLLSFGKVINVLHMLKKNYIRFNIITTLSKQNISYLEEMIAFGKSIGAKEHHFVRFIPIGRGSNYTQWYLSNEEWFRVIKRLQQSKRLLFDEKYLTGDCGAGTEFFCVLSNGDLTICTRKSQKELRLGNILNENIKEIWNNSQLLKEMRRTKKLYCTDCMQS